MVKKNDVLDTALDDFYNDRVKSITLTKKEERDTYKVLFGRGVSPTVNNVDKCAFINIAYNDINAEQLLKDIAKAYCDRAKKRLDEAQENFNKASSEFQSLY